MTSIAAIQTKDGAYIGADSRAGRGCRRDNEPANKIIEKSGFIFALCGSARTSNILTYRLKIPDPTIGQSILQYINTYFVDSFKESLRGENFAKTEGGIESFSNNIIFSYKG